MEYSGYIYKITNLCNNKVYIGQTRISVEHRYKSHLKSSKYKKDKNYHIKLYNAIRKYGEQHFKVETLLSITYKYKKVLLKNLDKLERVYILKFKSDQDIYGYNMTRGGQFKRIISNLENSEITESKLNSIYNRGSWNLNEINILSDYAEVILYNINNEEICKVKIDIEDINKIIQYKWYLYKCARGEYAKTSSSDIRMHNLILPPHDDLIVIHVNKDGLDNRKSNLKLVTKLQKQRENKVPSNNKSGIKGVYWNKDRNKWSAQITINNKTISLGRYINLEDAITARKNAEQKYYEL